MPQALAVAVRQTIVERHLAGASLPAIARALGRSPWTVRTVWRRYRDGGEAGLPPHYAAGGRPGPRHAPALYEAVLTLRRAHPGWGAGLIRTEVAARFPAQRPPHEATVRRWLRQAGLSRPPSPPPAPDPPRSRQPHARWQLDATEQIALADGRRVSWLAASDEASGAMLGAVVFPLCPVDAGRGAGGASGAGGVVYPVGAAGRTAPGQRLPVGFLLGAAARFGLVAARLGHGPGLEPPPAQARQRGRGAGARVCQRWVEPGTCQTAAELQARLDYFTTLQRERYPHHDAPSRLAAYPALAGGGRSYDPAPAAAQWDERRVWRFLAQQVVVRRVDRVGRISLANRALGVGRAWAGQEVTVRLAVVDDAPHWHIRDARGTLRRQQAAPELSRERIVTLDVSQRRPASRHPVKPCAHQEGEPYAR
jgi:transposase